MVCNAEQAIELTPEQAAFIEKLAAAELLPEPGSNARGGEAYEALRAMAEVFGDGRVLAV